MAAFAVLRTKILPPQPSARLLHRPRVLDVLREALSHRLTVLQAGAGYGKSTALISLARHHQPTAWFQITREDADPLVFLLYVCHSLRSAVPTLTSLPISLLEAWGSDRGPLPTAEIVDRILNVLTEELTDHLVVILDDVHLVLAISDEIALLLDRLIGLAPAKLHFVLSSRYPVQLPHLTRWTVKGEVLLLDQRLLAFQEDEIAHLFEQYHYPLSQEEVRALHTLTEGWAIALQLVWQSLRTGVSTSIEETLHRPEDTVESLFEVLAHEVLAQQPADVRRFLIQTATLRQLSTAACNALTRRTDSAEMLAYLERQDLFVVRQEGDQLRYHHIFHRFLRRQATEEQRKTWHRQAADYFAAQGDIGEALYHHLKAGDHENAAALLDTYGADLLAQGRMDTLRAYLDAFPPDTLHQHPALLFYLGELARLHSRFDEALGWYRQAEIAWRGRGQRDGIVRALRGQARVYLDTVNPSQAEHLLQEALRLSDGISDRESLARLYELLAENKLNAGHPEDAERLRHQAQRLREEGPSDSQLYYRVLLRTGRLAEARRLLEAKARAEHQHPIQTPRAHRETLLLLSLIYAFQGEGQAAYETAVQGTQRGVDLQSPYVAAVGHMRQGHALMLLNYPNRYALAEEQFRCAVEISQTLNIPRLRVEAFWGLCRAYGYQGDLARAAEVAEEGTRIALNAGDEWIASLVRLAMGAGLALAGRYEGAHTWLSHALRGFQECSDLFAQSATLLWLAWIALRTEEQTLLHQTLHQALTLVQTHGYDFLFLRPTLLGPPSERLWVPLLIFAREHISTLSAYAASLLDRLGLPGILYHPGYQLRVHTLGRFRVFLGDREVPPRAWRREKARQLFQLLLTHRGTALDREQIYEALWPDQPIEAAARNFKVTLNALYRALEPERPAGAPSAYILRDGSTYGLRPESDLWLDAAAFDDLLRRADENPTSAHDLLVQAVALFQGEYLPDARYEPWAEAERRRLNAAFLGAADRLCRHYLNSNRPAAAIDLAQRMLALDPSAERAYRHLMQAYALIGDHGQAAQTYHRCVETLRAELGVEPAPETTALYRELAGASHRETSPQ